MRLWQIKFVLVPKVERHGTSNPIIASVCTNCNCLRLEIQLMAFNNKTIMLAVFTSSMMEMPINTFEVADERASLRRRTY